MFSEDTKRLVRQRANGTCECSSHACPHFGRCRLPGKDFHHKKSPEKGGTDSAANCQFLCATCHQRIHRLGTGDGIGRL